MKLLSYKELSLKDELLPLFQHAFWWPFNPAEFEQEIKSDPRLTNSPVGFAAMEKGHIAGFVGVIEIPTRTIQGSIEKIGGIWGVVTHPAYKRQGIFTTLMEKSHNYSRKRNYRFSLLYTSQILIAYSFYKKLGYKDESFHSSAYKVINGTSKPAKNKPKKVEIDWMRILELYNQTVKNCTGFVIRDKQYMKGLEVRKRFSPEETILTEGGYALLKENDGSMYIRELIALTSEDAHEIITLIEKKAVKVVIAENVDESLLGIYESHGYQILNEGYDLLMSKQLTDVSFEEVYGSRFFATSTDSF
jgi:predicted acetyltransferase